MWDLLSKLAAFPDVVPVLAGRRIHPMSFNMFRDIGALGVQFTDQLFSPAIDADDFERVCGGLSLHNARQVPADAIVPQLASFFGKTGPREGPRFLDRWAQVDPIAADFTALRSAELTPRGRMRLWGQVHDARPDRGHVRTRRLGTEEHNRVRPVRRLRRVRGRRPPRPALIVLAKPSGQSFGRVAGVIGDSRARPDKSSLTPRSIKHIVPVSWTAGRDSQISGK